MTAEHLDRAIREQRTANTTVTVTHKGTPVAGQAVTVQLSIGDLVDPLKALDMGQPGDIIVVNAGGDTETSVCGGLMGGLAKNRGIRGMIVDGGKFDWLADKRYPFLSAPRPEYNNMTLGETFGNFAFAIACRVLGLRDLGPALSPFNAFLILTGIETLHLRMQRHVENAQAVAEFLARHPAVAWVSYAGLASSPYRARTSSTAVADGSTNASVGAAPGMTTTEPGSRG